MIKNKNHISHTPQNTPPEDDYYVIEKRRIAEETQKAHRIHEEDVHLHLVANIPYYEDAPESVRRCLVLLNNVLLHRFDRPGMIYWDFFKKTPSEIRDYADDFGSDVPPEVQETLISFFEQKKNEEKDMVDIGFDEDGEDDIPITNRNNEDGSDDSFLELDEENNPDNI